MKNCVRCNPYINPWCEKNCISALADHAVLNKTKQEGGEKLCVLEDETVSTVEGEEVSE